MVFKLSLGEFFYSYLQKSFNSVSNWNRLISLLGEKSSQKKAESFYQKSDQESANFELIFAPSRQGKNWPIQDEAGGDKATKSVGWQGTGWWGGSHNGGWPEKALPI